MLFFLLWNLCKKCNICVAFIVEQAEFQMLPRIFTIYYGIWDLWALIRPWIIWTSHCSRLIPRHDNSTKCVSWNISPHLLLRCSPGESCPDSYARTWPRNVWNYFNIPWFLSAMWQIHSTGNGALISVLLSTCSQCRPETRLRPFVSREFCFRTSNKTCERREMDVFNEHPDQISKNSPGNPHSTPRPLPSRSR